MSQDLDASWRWKYTARPSTKLVREKRLEVRRKSGLEKKIDRALDGEKERM